MHQNPIENERLLETDYGITGHIDFSYHIRVLAVKSVNCKLVSLKYLTQECNQGS